MRKVIYDVAMTLDGFIGHEDGSIGKFVAEGAHVDAYLERLQHYDTVVMGRKTYEFGYQYGLEPGARAYPHMEHYIFSSSLSFATSQVNVVKDEPHATVRQLKEEDGGPIYLCGGGALAGHLLKHKLVDELIIKLNPVLLGKGIPLFGEHEASAEPTLLGSERYDNGVALLSYQFEYH